MKKFKSKTLFLLLLFSLSTLASESNIVRAIGFIYIRADGSVEPSMAPILNVANSTYKLTDDIHNSIVIERNDIIVDGQGYELSGSGFPGYRGIDLSGRSNVTIKNMEIKAFDYGVYLAGSSNNTITSTNMSTNNYNGIYLVGFANNNSILGNTIMANNAEGIYLTNSSGNTVAANDITNNKYGIRLYGFSDNNTIARNSIVAGSTCTVCSGGGMYVTGSSNYNNITANTITNSGIYISGSANNAIARNSITNSGDGIYLYPSSNNNTIVGNTVVGNGGGISLYYYSSFNTIAQNDIIGNSGNGIYLIGCANNTMTENNIAYNADGIYLTGSSNNKIVANNIADNNRGIELYSSSNNLIYHNNFNNTIQVAGLLNFTNTWDNGYPSGGNYWNDYRGNDTDHDGLGDSPYVVGGNNSDRYPLMTPYAISEFPSVFISVLFMLATLLVATTYRRKGKKKF